MSLVSYSSWVGIVAKVQRTFFGESGSKEGGVVVVELCCYGTQDGETLRVRGKKGYDCDLFLTVQQVNNFIRVARGRNVYKRFLGYVWEKGGEIKFTKP